MCIEVNDFFFPERMFMVECVFVESVHVVKVHDYQINILQKEKRNSNTN